MIIAKRFRARPVALLTSALLMMCAGISESSAASVALPSATKPARLTGAAKIDSTVTGATGTWKGSPAFTYKWYACSTSGSARTTVPAGCAAIKSATKTSFLITTSQLGKYLRFMVTAKNRRGSVISVSAATLKVTSPYQLLWSEEFNGPAGVPDSVQTSNKTADPSLPWKAMVSGWGGGNRERQYYTDGVVQYNEDGSVKQYAVELDGNGNLLLNAAKPQAAGENHPSTAPSENCWYGTCEFVSGRIDTQDRVGFKNGLLEARVKIPNSPSTWPAFWMLGANYPEVPWPNCGEIDIMETASTRDRGYSYFGSLHSRPSNGIGITKVMGSFDLYTGYHTFGLLRTPTKIEFRFDGKTYFSITKAEATSSVWAVNGQNREWPFDQEYFMILNLAMGGTLGGGPGGLTVPAATGGTLAVDWVRFSSVNGVGEVITH